MMIQLRIGESNPWNDTENVLHSDALPGTSFLPLEANIVIVLRI